MNTRIVAAVAAISGILAFSHASGAADTAPAAVAEPLYATVNGKTITQGAFNAAYANYLRQKYYHGQVPEDGLAQAKTAVGNLLVERILMLDEAARRGLIADEQAIADTIAGYEARYAGSERWQQNRNRMLPGLKQQLVEQDLLRQIEAIGRNTSEPTDEAVRKYYDAHPELFTEPEKMRLHTILLKVDPSAPGTVWDAAREEAARLVARLRSGQARFEEVASLHSHDRSADQGGDMGYLHRGMIPEQVQAQIDEHPLGTVGDPLDVLEGVAIFRLDERIQPKLMVFGDVVARARELLSREQTNQAWESFIAGLRQTAVIQVIQVIEPPPAPATAKN